MHRTDWDFDRDGLGLPWVRCRHCGKKGEVILMNVPDKKEPVVDFTDLLGCLPAGCLFFWLPFTFRRRRRCLGCGQIW